MRVRLAVGTADSGGTNKFGELFLRPGTTRAARVPRRVAARRAGRPIKTAQDAGSADVDPTNPSRNPDSTHARQRRPLRLGDRSRRPDGLHLPRVPDHAAAGRGAARAPRPDRATRRSCPASHADTLRVANFNMENLFAAGMTDDGHTFTQAEVDAKTTRLADAIGNVLHRPDVVVTEEVAALAPLQEVARKLHGYPASGCRRPTRATSRSASWSSAASRSPTCSQIGRDATTTLTGLRRRPGVLQQALRAPAARGRPAQGRPELHADRQPPGVAEPPRGRAGRPRRSSCTTRPPRSRRPGSRSWSSATSTTSRTARR